MSADPGPIRPASAGEQRRLVACGVAVELGATVQVLLYGGWPYEATVTRLAPRRVCVEFLTRFGAFRERWVQRTEVFPPGALQALRAAPKRPAPEEAIDAL